MDIPKTASISADDDRASFLILPAEMRNMVYELLFECDGPLLIHNVLAYYATKPVRSQDEREDVDMVEDTPNHVSENIGGIVIDPDTARLSIEPRAKKDFATNYQRLSDMKYTCMPLRRSLPKMASDRLR